MIRLIDAVNFNEFYKAIKDQKMSGPLAYKLAKLVSVSLAPEQKIYTDRLRETVLTKAELDEKGQPKAAQNVFGVQIKSGEEVALMQEILDLQNVEIDVKPVFTMDELSSLMATPEQFQAALPFIIEEE